MSKRDVFIVMLDTEPTDKKGKPGLAFEPTAYDHQRRTEAYVLAARGSYGGRS